MRTSKVLECEKVRSFATSWNYVLVKNWIKTKVTESMVVITYSKVDSDVTPTFLYQLGSFLKSAR